MPESDFIEDWRPAARPLLIVDEIRHPGAIPGEQLVSTVLLETDTRTIRWTEAADMIRDSLPKASRNVCFKGSTLYGSRQRGSHRPMREYVRRTLRECRAGFVVTTSSRVLRVILRLEEASVPYPPERRTALGLGPVTTKLSLWRWRSACGAAWLRKTAGVS